MLHNPYPRAANETKNCPLGLCPIIKFTLEDGDASDADCRSRIYTADQMKLEPEVGYAVKFVNFISKNLKYRLSKLNV